MKMPHGGKPAKSGLRAALSSFLVGVLASTLMPVGAAQAASGPQLLVGIYTEGGFISPTWSVSRIPQLLVYSDGSVIAENQRPTRGYIHEALTGKTAAGAATSFAVELLRLAKTPKGGWGFPGVADVPNTRVKVSLGGKRLDNSVYALAFTNGPQLTASQIAARKALAGAIAKFQKSLNVTKPYQPVLYEVRGQTAIMGGPVSGGVGMANPAAVYCASIGGETGIIETPEGQAGTCTLFGGEVVDEWVLYRKALATLSSWPEGYTVPSSPDPIAGLSCVIIPARKLVKQLSVDNEFGRWLLPSGQAFTVILRPVLRGEKACHRSA
ncbi:MAG: hypothetical protein RLZ69_116 [Actinomycetota bacterium]